MGRPKGSKNKKNKSGGVKEKKLKLTVSRIICSKCGTKKTTTKPQMDKLISLFGSIEDVHEKYHCMKCRKEFNVRKDGKAKPEKRTRQPKIKLEKTEEGKVILPSWMVGSSERHIIPVAGTDLFRPNDGPVCHNSTLFLEHRNCNKCTLFEFCNSTVKNIVTETGKKIKKQKIKETK